ncbi:MAG: L,D-transpeptidase family protein [Hyphomicrobiaceae bacterium]
MMNFASKVLLASGSSLGKSVRGLYGAVPGVAIALGLGVACAGLSGGRADAAEGDFWNVIQGFHGSQSTDRKPEPIVDTLEDLRPNKIPFRSDEMLTAMDGAFAFYQKIASAGGWPSIPGPRMIRPGDDDQRVPALRKRLTVEGYLRRSGGHDSYSYDGELEVAVKRFQENHGLRPSGRVDRPTLDELNITAEARLKQLRLNAVRLQELNHMRPEERYILVNVPAFQLEAVERYDVQLRHRVIVGRNERETPNVKATIKALNFFPYWRVPDSIGTLDLVPRLRKEPDYLEKEKIRVFSAQTAQEMDTRTIDWKQVDPTKIKFKQDPGPQNALGLVRIDMSNEHGVYMHDTPMKKLFEQRSRNFSAGCVRVQEVFQLAEWIARLEPGWDQPGRVEQILQSGQAVDLTLSRPLPVYFAYVTAWAEPNGVVQFRPDIYNRDGVNSKHSGDVDPNEAPPAPIPPQALAP